MNNPSQISGWINRIRERPLEFALLIIACALPLMRLGIGEIQEWDESLYAIRAEACLRFGAWLDQSQYSIAGLYSATHPPLGVWMIAISRLLFGTSTLATRLPVGLSGSAAILGVYAVLRRWTDRSSALLGAALIASADLFLLLSHRAQLDVIVVCFAVWTVYALDVAIAKASFRFSVLSGCMLAGALLSKFAVGLFVVPFLLFLAIANRRGIRSLLITLSTAALFSLPWFVMMLTRHPDYWHHVTASVSNLQLGAYNPQHSPWWYYINRLLIAVPLIPVALCCTRASDRKALALLAWLAIVYLLLIAFRTHMPHFALLLVLPGALLTGYLWNKRRVHSKLLYIVSTVLGFVLILWSASEQLRLLITHRMEIDHVIILPIAVLLLLGCTALLFVVHRSVDRGMLFAAVLLACGCAHIASWSNSAFSNGGEIVGARMLQEHLVRPMLVHLDYPRESFAPQLAYYTHGRTIGWDGARRIDTITWDSAMRLPKGSLQEHDAIVIMRFWDRFYEPTSVERATLDSLRRKCSLAFTSHLGSRSYDLYY